MARGDPTTYVKLPADLKELLEGSAHENRRSLTAEIVHILSRHFAQIAQSNADYQAGRAAEEAEGISVGLSDPIDRAAVLKVLLLSEVMVLKRRVDDLGGREVVMATEKADLVKQVKGPAIGGTNKEQTTYFSNLVASTPLTALLTSSELEKIAQRIVAIQQATSSLQGTTND